MTTEDNHHAGERFYNHSVRNLQYKRELEVLPGFNAVVRTATLNGDVKPLVPPGNLKDENIPPSVKAASKAAGKSAKH